MYDEKLWVDVQVGGKELRVLVDSGADANFVHIKVIKWLKIPTQELSNSYHLYLADGRLAKQGLIMHKVNIWMRILEEWVTIQFDVLKEFKYCLIMGMSWLRERNPTINWRTKEFCSIMIKVKDLSEHKSWDHEIPLKKEKQPTWKPLYSMSEDQLKLTRKYIDKNLAREFIRPSKSPAEYSVLFISKKDGTKRLCVDYWQLNNITERDSYPLLLIEELGNRLGNAKWFSIIDIDEAYYRVQMKKEEEWKMTFRTRYGHYEYTVMPFGLKNAPMIFQRLTNDTIWEYLDIFAVAYLNDILVYLGTKEEHDKHVQLVLAALEERGLPIKKEKCVFEKQEVKFLEHIIWPGEIGQDSDKVEIIQMWLKSRSVRDVQSFLGLANYYRR